MIPIYFFRTQTSSAEMQHQTIKEPGKFYISFDAFTNKIKFKKK